MQEKEVQLVGPSILSARSINYSNVIGNRAGIGARWAQFCPPKDGIVGDDSGVTEIAPAALLLSRRAYQSQESSSFGRQSVFRADRCISTELGKEGEISIAPSRPVGRH